MVADVVAVLERTEVYVAHSFFKTDSPVVQEN